MSHLPLIEPDPALADDPQQPEVPNLRLVVDDEPDDPEIDDDTLVLWIDGDEGASTVRWGDMPVQDRKTVEWAGQCWRGGYPI